VKVITKQGLLAVAGALAATTALAAQAPVALDIPSYPFTVLPQGSDEARFAVTVATRPAEDGAGELYLAVTKVNPALAPDADWAKTLYDGERHRPMTYAEADAACRSLDWAGAKWSLPNPDNLRELRRVGAAKYLRSPGHPSRLGENFRVTSGAETQAGYFWTDAQNGEFSADLHVAMQIESGTQVSHTVQKPLQVVCVTWFAKAAATTTNESEAKTP
jgi:hypothetical protein